MNQLVDPQTLISAIPLPAPAMTRYEKLMRWAKIVREQKEPMRIFHLLERWSQAELDQDSYFIDGSNAFAVAMADSVFAENGLKPTTGHLSGVPTGSVGQVMRFMELTQQQLHEFSCDCGGAISNTEMADRIERLA